MISGSQFRNIRKTLGLRQSDITLATGVEQASISNFENNVGISKAARVLLELYFRMMDPVELQKMKTLGIHAYLCQLKATRDRQVRINMSKELKR